MSADTKPRPAPSLVEQILAPLACSFCDKTAKEVRKLIAREGNFPCICDECVSVCNAILGA
jgi:hypothetical protein